MAVSGNTPANRTPATEVVDGVPSNLDAARPVIDRIKDIDRARDEEAGTDGGSNVYDNTPETAAANEAATKDAPEDAAPEEKAKVDAKKAGETARKAEADEAKAKQRGTEK